jgi:hypothetical protein
MDLTPDQLAFIRRKRRSFADKKRAIMASIAKVKDPARTFQPSDAIAGLDRASALIYSLKCEILTDMEAGQ